ncbi:MAG: sodium-dependent transporter [Ruminococcaceae bacterium]|nr:sodium-dependent transporter [Oscillospiraceae bacterium]
METKRNSFTSKIGFVFAAAGSAVGLGNLWRFPYLAAKYGGGIFLLTYIILAVTFGFTLMVAEIAIGRKTGKSAIEAYGQLNNKWGFIGKMTAIVPMIILPYYCVIGGWVTKYFSVYLLGNGSVAAGDTYFGDFISKPVEPIIWLLVYIAATAIIVMLGVEKGIEKFSKILMPVLVVLSVGIAIYTITLDGATEGVKYYFMPDFSKFSVMTVLGALGQLFYSMSIAMGIMITYGSYMPKEANIEKSVHQIELFDTGIAMVAGLMIVPSVFVFTGGDEAKLQAGAGLMFEMLPKIFDSMPFGSIIGFVFFLLVFFAALTSSISLMETVVSILRDKFNIPRIRTCLVVLVGCIILALPSSLGYGHWDGVKILGLSILDFFDFLSNSVIMPIVAFLTCIFVGFIVKPSVITNEVKLAGKFKQEKFFTVMIKYIAPFCILAILISSVLNGLGIIKI